MPSPHRSAWPSPAFWKLSIVVAVLFIMGGSSRADVQSLAILNPAMVTLCGAALLTLKKEHWYDKKWFLAGFALSFLLNLFYLVPLPGPNYSLSQGLVDVSVILSAAEIIDASQILTISPVSGWQSLFSLFAPLAVFLFAIQLKSEDLRRTLILIISIGAISGVIGILQSAGSVDGSLYLYNITNKGSAVGLFANRNHAAVFLACLFPILTLLSARMRIENREGQNTKQLIVQAVAIVLVPLILVTGSRTGMLAAVVGIIGGIMLYKTHIATRTGLVGAKSIAPIPVLSICLTLVFTTIYFSRAIAIDRTFAELGSETGRADFWAASSKLFWKYFPIGFGPGSFDQAYKTEEPMALLSSAYLNRVHNDWLEIVLTYGAFGVLMLTLGVAYYIHRTFKLWVRMDGARSAVAMGRLASIIIAIFAIASMTDYPLRTPSLMGLAALVLVWFITARFEPQRVYPPVLGASPKRPESY